MHVSLRDLKGVSQGGLVARYVVLGTTTFVAVEFPDSGTAGTSIEDPCVLEHWGFVLQGELELTGRGEQTFPAGTAFYIAPGGEPHVLRTGGRAVVAGFTPTPEGIDDSRKALQARGLDTVSRLGPLRTPPELRVLGIRSRVQTKGAIEIETAEMGRWLFTRATFGPVSGFTSGWCDLTHWGLVLSGDVIISHEDEIEVLSAGDVYYCPPGPPGHTFEVADEATIVDYTPISELDAVPRQAEWRRRHRRRRQADDAKTAEPEGRGSKRGSAAEGATKSEFAHTSIRIVPESLVRA